ALPVMYRGFKLQMRKLDLAAVWPVPLMHPKARGPAKSRIKVEALIPQGSGTGDLRGRAPEEYRRKRHGAAAPGSVRPSCRRRPRRHRCRYRLGFAETGSAVQAAARSCLLVMATFVTHRVWMGPVRRSDRQMSTWWSARAQVPLQSL